MALSFSDYRDGIVYQGATASTIGPFHLQGGKYFLYGSAADTTNTLDILLPDGSTYQAVDSETTTAFSKMIDLPAGQFKIVTNSSTAVQGGLVKIPYQV